MSSQSKKKISGKAFDKKFSEGEDMREHVDWSKAVKRINLDVPVWAIKALDKEADRRGITRQSLIKTWLIDRLDAVSEANDKAVI